MASSSISSQFEDDVYSKKSMNDETEEDSDIDENHKFVALANELDSNINKSTDFIAFKPLDQDQMYQQVYVDNSIENQVTSTQDRPSPNALGPPSHDIKARNHSKNNPHPTEPTKKVRKHSFVDHPTVPNSVHSAVSPMFMAVKNLNQVAVLNGQDISIPPVPSIPSIYQENDPENQLLQKMTEMIQSQLKDSLEPILSSLSHHQSESRKFWREQQKDISDLVQAFTRRPLDQQEINDRLQSEIEELRSQNEQLLQEKSELQDKMEHDTALWARQFNEIQSKCESLEEKQHQWQHEFQQSIREKDDTIRQYKQADEVNRIQINYLQLELDKMMHVRKPPIKKMIPVPVPAYDPGYSTHDGYLVLSTVINGRPSKYTIKI